MEWVSALFSEQVLTYILKHFFTYMYIKNTQITLLKFLYQMSPEWKKRKKKQKSLHQTSLN